MALSDRERQVEREANNAQTVQFVADRQSEMVKEARDLAEKLPKLKEAVDLPGIAELEERHQQVLMEVAAEQRVLATDINLERKPDATVQDEAREHRKDLLEMARVEGRLAEALLEAAQEHPEVGGLAEQAARNQDLLRGVAADQGALPRAGERTERKQGHTGR